MRPLYTPILKARWGELKALAEVDSAGRNAITPLIDVPPLSQADPDEGDVGETRNIYDGMGGQLSAAWAQTGPLWIDTGALRPEDYRLGDPHAYLAREAEESGLRLVPVVRGTPGSAERVSTLGFGDGVVVRLHASDFGAGLRDVLARVAADTGVRPGDTDIVVDLGAVGGDAGESSCSTARQMLLALPNPRGWRSVVLAASSFPQDLRMITGAGEARVRRAEWLLWRRLRTRDPGFEVRFGDYAISHPAFPRGRRGGPPSLRYTAADAFFLLKRRKPAEGQPFPYRDLARYVVRS